jgi:hypothetical protein
VPVVSETNEGALQLGADMQRGDQKRLAEELTAALGGNVESAETRVSRFVSGKLRPNTAERIWFMENKGVPLLAWDKACADPGVDSGKGASRRV